METNESLNRIEQLAAEAGLTGEIEARIFCMVFDLVHGRSQTVFVRPTGTTSDERVIVTFYSVARVIERKLFRTVSHKAALELLRLNNDLQFARFGIDELDDRVEVIASADHILETLEPDEFKTTSYYVALAADIYEAKYSDQDLF